MRIHRLEVEGFRSLKKVSWEPGALNVVIGANGSGKSNLLLLLDLLKRGAHGNLRELINNTLGINSTSWDSEANIISVNLKFDDFYNQGNSTTNSIYYISIGINFQFGSYVVTNEHLFVTKDETLSDPTSKLIFCRKADSTHVLQRESYTDISTSDSIDQSELFISTANYPVSINFESFRLKKYLSQVYTSLFINSSRSSELRLPTSVSLEKILKPEGSNLIQVLHTLYTSDRNFKADIDSAMNAAFGNDYEELVFPPASDQRVQLRIRWKSLKREQSALDISDGTLRFLYLLAILANPEPSPLIAIDEPETGLHPSMFPIIAEFAAEASKKSQIIFTTHSDQFLTACQEFDPTVTVASWSEGQTHLKVVDKEQLKDWLAHYSLGSLFRSGELEELL